MSDSSYSHNHTLPHIAYHLYLLCWFNQRSSRQRFLILILDPHSIVPLAQSVSLTLQCLSLCFHSYSIVPLALLCLSLCCVSRYVVSHPVCASRSVCASHSAMPLAQPVPLTLLYLWLCFASHSIVPLAQSVPLTLQYLSLYCASHSVCEPLCPSLNLCLSLYGVSRSVASFAPLCLSLCLCMSLCSASHSTVFLALLYLLLYRASHSVVSRHKMHVQVQREHNRAPQSATTSKARLSIYKNAFVLELHLPFPFECLSCELHLSFE
jgi:hypothetical protein